MLLFGCKVRIFLTNDKQISFYNCLDKINSFTENTSKVAKSLMPKWGGPPVHLPEWTHEDGEVFLTRPKTSHKKSGNFSAEVGKVLCRSWQSSLQKSAKFSAEVGKVLCRS